LSRYYLYTFYVLSRSYPDLIEASAPHYLATHNIVGSVETTWFGGSYCTLQEMEELTSDENVVLTSMDGAILAGSLDSGSGTLDSGSGASAPVPVDSPGGTTWPTCAESDAWLHVNDTLLEVPHTSEPLPLPRHIIIGSPSSDGIPDPHVPVRFKASMLLSIC